MQYEYPLDLTGTAASNLIRGEPQVITDVNGSFSQIIIPDYAPFYLDNLALEHIATDGTRTILNKDIDYFVAYPYQDLARESGKLAFGGLVVINKNAKGRFKVTYQTIGDKWVANSNYVKEILHEKAYNPRVAYWDSITNVQDKFPPVEHTHDITESDKWPALLEAINSVARAIANRNFSESSIYPTVVNYLDNFLPTLITKEAIGLSNVENVGIATDVEVNEWESVRKLVTLDSLIKIIEEGVTTPVTARFQALTTAMETIDQALGSLITDYREFLNTDEQTKLSFQQEFAVLNSDMQQTRDALVSIRQEIRLITDDAYNQQMVILDRLQNIDVAIYQETTAIKDSINTLSENTNVRLSAIDSSVSSLNQTTSSILTRVSEAETQIAEANEAIIEQVAKGASVPTPFTFFLAQ